MTRAAGTRAAMARRSRGAVTIEMTLVGIPLIFALISIVEISRGMWIYNTLAYAAKEAVRFSVVHGENCRLGINSCGITVARVAQEVRDKGIGLVCDSGTTYGCITMTLTPAPAGTCTTLQNCLSNTNPFPPAGANQIGINVRLTLVIPFRSALAMFWPGAGSTSFATVNLPASASDFVRF
jgi:hypothetical protein